MGDLNEDCVLDTVGAITALTPEYAQDALDALSKGMDIVGERFEDSEYFVGDLIFAGELFTEALERIKSAFPLEPVGRGAGEKVILATVEGDFHDIGKNIVKSVLQSNGFHVIDLGVDVSPSSIVARTIEEGAKIIALSAVLNSSLAAMERTVRACEAAGIRDRVTIILGGACVTERVVREFKADYYGQTPEDTVRACLSVLV